MKSDLVALTIVAMSTTLAVQWPAGGGAAEPDRHRSPQAATTVGSSIASAATAGGKTEPTATASDAGDGGGRTTAERTNLVVVSTRDHGPGSLRQAILDANAAPGADTVTFDGEVFAEPQTITLESELPEIRGDLTIDGYIPDRLWHATGAVVSGAHRLPVFRVAAGARVTIRHLTVAEGCSTAGSGIANLGDLVVRGVTFWDNESASDGGALLNLGGAVVVINSTFVGNKAADRGGALANVGGTATVTNCTFSENTAAEGGGLFSDGELLLRNTILANSEGDADCVAARIDPASTRNLIERGEGCGTPITSADPRLDAIGKFNGPTMTVPLGGGSPAINLGDNASAVDEYGQPLIWDQRGNGDPRFVAGYTDIGAFEHQRFPDLTVDTVDDNGLRACTRAGRTDCSLRGAIELANAADEALIITFDTQVFAEVFTITVVRPLPRVTNDITLDATGTGGVTLAPAGGFPLFEETPGDSLHLIQVTLPGPDQQSPAD